MTDVYGIIYAEVAKSVRRIVVSDDPGYDYAVHVGDGEALLEAPVVAGTDIFAARRAIREAFATDPPEPLVALVDANGLVTALIMADPAIDTVAERDLIPAYEGVAIGQTYDAPTDSFIVPEQIVPAGTTPDGTPYDEYIIPAHPVPKP